MLMLVYSKSIKHSLADLSSGVYVIISCNTLDKAVLVTRLEHAETALTCQAGDVTQCLRKSVTLTSGKTEIQAQQA